MREDLCDAKAERAVVRIVTEEANVFGWQTGRQLLARCLLETSDFVTPFCGALWAATAKVISAGISPVPSAVWTQLRPVLPGDASWEPFAEILDGGMELTSASQLESYAGVVRSLSTRRRCVAAARRIRNAAVDGACDESALLAMFTYEAKAIPSRVSSWLDFGAALDEAEAAIRLRSDGGRDACVPSGFSDLDRITGGFQPTLCVIAAMPGVGKSSLWASVLRNNAILGNVTATFSMEDRKDWLAYRLLAHESGINQFVLRNRRVSDEKWSQLGDGFCSARAYAKNILLDDRPALGASEVLACARHAVTERGARMVALDNMTAMSFHRGQRMDLEIQDFLSGARALANELQVPFVVLSHVKRREGLEQKTMPRLTDCSETSAFEKLSRLAYGLSRDPESEILTVGVLKNTNGRAGVDVNLPFSPSAALVEPDANLFVGRYES